MTLFELQYSSTIYPCGPSESLSYCEGRWGPGLALSLRTGSQALFCSDELSPSLGAPCQQVYVEAHCALPIPSSSPSGSLYLVLVPRDSCQEKGRCLGGLTCLLSFISLLQSPVGFYYSSLGSAWKFSVSNNCFSFSSVSAIKNSDNKQLKGLIFA